jgi:tight adherence protein C
MPVNAILEYPEFIAATLIGMLAIVLGLRKTSSAFYLPVWLTAPAGEALRSMPDKYIVWLVKRQTWSGWRSNSAFGILASLKVYLPMLLSLSAFIVPVQHAALIVVIAFFAPDAVLYFCASRRQLKIKETLPQALDLMVLCVDAGLGLDATLQRIASEKSVVAKCLNEELIILGRDVLLGMDRERAYQELFNRTGVSELKALGSALNQSAKLGLSVAKTLRSQADFLRMKLSQKAEEKASKLPVYMAFPLWFFIMPALMVVLLAPSLITFFENEPSSLAREVVK